jgi:hypothetical protein
MSDHLALWNAVDDIDPKFTKPITGKDYSGTSPQPHYLIKLATEHLGPVGHGFGWDVVAEGFQQMGDTHLHWCRISFWWVKGDTRGHFDAYGQTKAAYVTSKGTHRVDEDAPKKSLTDAVVKALSQIGFAANIFLGRWDDSKYVAQVNADFREAEKPKPDPEAEQKAAERAKAHQAGVDWAKGCADKAEDRDGLTKLFASLGDDMKKDPGVRDYFKTKAATLPPAAQKEAAE